MGQDKIWIKPNKGQWHSNIDYKIGIPGGELFLEQQGFTYYFHNGSEAMHRHKHDDDHDDDHHEHHGHHDDHDHDSHEGDDHDEISKFSGHTVKTTFLNSNSGHSYKELSPSAHVENYFLGNDSTKWVSNLKLYNEINYVDLYNGINLNLYQHQQTLKYDIVVQPSADINEYKVLYSGQDSIKVIDGKLYVYTSRGHFYESEPVAFQTINGLKRKVICNYVLSGDTVSFDFPKGYQNNYELTIDPVLAFSTFTGATSDNWGMTACPDVNDQLVAGGIVFGSGYPTSAGAFSSNFSGGQVDLGITKFNATGTGLVYSTFIGGSGSETPHSIIVNDQDELYIMGATSSQNFPVGVNGYQNFHMGGNTILVDGINFVGGTDIFVIRLNLNGSAITAGTFLGGSNNDGISNPNNTAAGSNIAFNYGDQLRGEIIVDQNSNVFITSTTGSSNFPTSGGFSTSLSGDQDAIVVKLNPTLSTLDFGTYVGGSGLESGNSIQLSSTGDIFTAGGTTSSNFPQTAGQYGPTFNGGTTDGYILKLEAPNYGNPKSTYLGTNGYDQSYFVQLDLQDKVYVYGQSDGNYPVSAGLYTNANSGQFIHKLSNDLTLSEWSSVFGAGTGEVEISPTAFLVSDCYEIYVAGWGGNVNSNNSNASSSTTNGLPTTFDAYQAVTSGSNFWLGLFTPDMASLKYATFMGNTAQVTGGDHVDGGTSRFNKAGKVYHAVCAACQGLNTGFPTTPGAFSTTNNSSNCNMAAFLFELSKIEAVLTTAVPVTCLPNATNFVNTSINGNTYQWYFGDGDSSDVFAPTHLYPGPGTYDVMLIVSDINGCYEPDTAYTEVTVEEPFYEAYSLEDTICPGTSVQVFATGGDSYAWGPPGLFDNPNIASPFATITTDTTLSVTIFNDCGQTVLDVQVYVFETFGEVGPDTAICVGNSVEISAEGGGSYSWSPGISLNDSTLSNPIATPAITTFYICDITTPDGCHVFDTLLVTVDQSIAIPNLIDEVTICQGDQIQIIANGSTSYNWTPAYNISATNIYNPYVYPEYTTYYYVGFTNACGVSHDSVLVNVNIVDVLARPDTTVCPGEPVLLWARSKKAESFLWNPTANVENPKTAQTITRPNIDTEYKVIVTDNFGCTNEAYCNVNVFDLQELKVSADVHHAVQGDLIPIWAEGDGNIQWVPPAFVTCPTCHETEVFPPVNTNFTAILTDENGCKIQDDVAIFYDPLIYVPNVFTPDNNNFNNVFKAVTQNVTDFEMTIYNRWGEVIFQSFDKESHWDGYYHGRKVQDGVYVWKIKYTDLNGVKGELIGHVSLLK